MKVPLSWLREFADVPDDVANVSGRLGGCGFNVESVDGEVMEFEITANRPDCLSVYGLAREAAAAFDVTLSPFPAPNVPAGAAGPVKVSIADADCGRYALAVADVGVGPSPAWLASRLTAAGVRPINNIVDVTNYVMLELGHPMHAFDAAKLAGPEIRVRRARPGERLVTLDGVTRELDETMLVIADREAPVAIAGVMGGATSEVSAGTTRVVFESAWFLPSSVRATSRRLGLKTEASARFERGADAAAPVAALQRALHLLSDIGAARPTTGITDVFPMALPSRTVALARAHIARLLGEAVPDADVERVLTRLGFSLSPGAGGWQVGVPTFRVDVTREADLIEEVGRHYGLDRIPATFPALRQMPSASAAGVMRGRLVRRLLCGAGLQEAVTFTFIEQAAAARFGDAGDVIAIRNPLSETFAALRPSLVPGLLQSLLYNRNRQASDVRLFETGTVFSRSRGERPYAGWVLSGSRGAHWSGDAGPIGFTDAKGVAELLAAAAGHELGVLPGDDLPWLVRGQAARLLVGGQRAGWVGRLAGPEFSLDPVLAGEIDLDVLGLTASPAATRITPLPRHPSVVRDLSILVDERLPAADVRGTIRSSAPATLVSVHEFDRYQGAGVPAGRVSLSLRLTFRDRDRTLTDAEVQQAIETIVAALERDHRAVLRGK